MVAEPRSREEMPLGFGEYPEYPLSTPPVQEPGSLLWESLGELCPWWGKSPPRRGCSRVGTQLMLSCRRWAEPALGEQGRKGEGVYQQKRFSLDPGRIISKRKGKKDTTVGNISNGKTRILT